VIPSSGGSAVFAGESFEFSTDGEAVAPGSLAAGLDVAAGTINAAGLTDPSFASGTDGDLSGALREGEADALATGAATGDDFAVGADAAARMPAAIATRQILTFIRRNFPLHHPLLLTSAAQVNCAR